MESLHTGVNIQLKTQLKIHTPPYPPPKGWGVRCEYYFFVFWSLGHKTGSRVRNEASDAPKSSCKQNLGVHLAKVNVTYRVGTKVA